MANNIPIKVLLSRQLYYEPQKGECIDSVIPEYGMYIDKDGDRVFGVVGKRDCAADVQSYLEQSDYSLIMKSLNPSKEDFDGYSDIVDMVESIDPTDLIAVSRLSKNLELAFNELPIKEKEYYGNNPKQFAASALRGEFTDRVAKKYEQFEIKQAARPPVTDSNGNSDELTALRKELEMLRGKIEQTSKLEQGGEQ